MALRRAKWTHKFNTKINLRKVLRQFFGMPKILPPLTKLLPEPEKLHRRSYDGLRCPHEWPDVVTIRAEFEHFLYRVSIWCQFRYSVVKQPKLVGLGPKYISDLLLHYEPSKHLRSFGFGLLLVGPTLTLQK